MDNWYILHIYSSIYLIKKDAKCTELQEVGRTPYELAMTPQS